MANSETEYTVWQPLLAVAIFDLDIIVMMELRNTDVQDVVHWKQTLHLWLNVGLDRKLDQHNLISLQLLTLLVWIPKLAST